MFPCVVCVSGIARAELQWRWKPGRRHRVTSPLSCWICGLVDCCFGDRVVVCCVWRGDAVALSGLSRRSDLDDTTVDNEVISIHLERVGFVIVFILIIIYFHWGLCVFQTITTADRPYFSTYGEVPIFLETFPYKRFYPNPSFGFVFCSRVLTNPATPQVPAPAHFSSCQLPPAQPS